MNKVSILAPFESPILGSLKNRIAMAPMTRSFATVDHCCTRDIAAYYERRARDGVGLILTEGIIVHPSGDGYNSVTHLHTESQMQSWKQVVSAVHLHGTKIYAQLWHCGRISHSDYTSGYDVVSSTSRAASGVNRQNNKPFGTPRALDKLEMPGIYDMFCHSALLALDAGFDGVEIHMGHGYLVDQFLDGRVNDRADEYGGSVANRCRFAIEMLRSVIDRIGANRVMVRISPSRMMGSQYDWPDLYEMLEHLIVEFKNCGLNQLDISCANADYFKTSGKIVRYIRKRWPFLIIGGASLNVDEAGREVADGYLDLVTWGRAILANPDFVSRLLHQTSLRAFDDSMRNSLF